MSDERRNGMEGRVRGLMGKGMAIFMFLCLSVLTQGANAALNFETSVISGFNGPYHIIAADFNKDTKPDLAVTNWDGNQVVILLGDGLGHYSVASTLATTATHPNFIAAGDFDNNGSTDLAITNGIPREVTLLFNDGSGTSWTTTALQVGTEADLVSVVAGNFTPATDSHSDLFIVKDSGIIADFYEVWQGDGTGAFTEVASGDTGSLPIYAMAGDFNGDTRLDIAIANYDSNSVTILLGNGDGTFFEAAGSPMSVGIQPRVIAAGHFNGDGLIDLAVTNSGENTVSILLGNGDGTFTGAGNISSSGGVGTLAVADFDGDGKNDIAVTRSSLSFVSIYRGNDDGTFETSPADFPAGTTPFFIVAVDMDKDGKPDLAVTNYGSNEVAILLNRSGVCIPPPSGLVSWWSGDNNALDIIGTNHGTLHGSVTFAPGKIGQAFSFDGGEDGYVEIPNTAELNPGGAFTVDGWFYIDPTASGNAGEIATLVAKTEGSTGNGWALYFDDRWSTKSLKFVLGTVLEFQNAIPTPDWYHIAGVFDPSTTPNSKLYVNGTLVASVNCGGAADNSLNVRIGAMYWTDSYHQGNDRLNGKADEVEFFNRALSDTEIAAIYNAGSAGTCRPCATQPPEMVSRWTGDGDANDIVGANDGALMNGATLAPGLVGQAFSFNGVDQYVEVPHSALLDLTGGLTLEAWFKLRTAGHSSIFSKADYNGSQSVTSYGLQILPDGGVNAALYGTYPADNWSTELGLVETDRWYHIAFTWDGTIGPADNVQLYLDGALVQAWTKSPTPLNVTTQSLTLGSMKPPTYYGHMDGLIDEAAVFNRALSGEEIAAIYNAGSAGKCTPTGADIALTKTDDPDPVSVGSNVTYTITITNNGPDTASTVILTDTLPTGAAFVSANAALGACVEAGGTVTCTIRDMSNGATATATVVVTATTGGAMTNTATVISDTGDPDPGNNTSTQETTVQSTLSVNVDPQGGGTVTGTGIDCPGDCTEVFSAAQNITLTAAPDTGYSFGSWTGDCSVTAGNQCTVSTSQNRSVTAAFILNTYTVAGTVTGGNGSISCTSPVNYGASSICTVAPDLNYHLISLTDNSLDVTASVTGAQYVIDNVDADHTVVAVFAINTYTVSTSVPGGHGTVSCESPVDHGNSSDCTITPESGYLLKSLTDNGADVMGSVSGTTYTIISVTANHTVEGAFAMLLINPKQGTIGTILEMKGSAFGSKKGKGVLQSGDATYALKVLEWNVGGSGVIKAQLTKAPVGGATCDVMVYPKGAGVLTELSGFTVKKPEITGLDVNEGKIGTTIKITGKFFGYKKGKIFLKTGDVRKSCKVLSWPATPETGTGMGQIQFVVPKVALGTYRVVVQNKVSEDTYENFKVLP